MVVPHREQGLLVGPALDSSQEVGQFFMRGQGYRLVIVCARAAARIASLRAPPYSSRWGRGILAKFGCAQRHRLPRAGRALRAAPNSRSIFLFTGMFCLTCGRANCNVSGFHVCAETEGT